MKRGIVKHRAGGSRLVDALCRRVETYVGEREAAECWGSAARFSSVLDRLPGVTMLYARLGPGDPPLLVEIGRPGGGFLSPGRDAVEPGPEVELVLSVLARDYGGPEYYNVPLITAHMSATISRAQLESYVRLLESLAAARGVRLRLARRTLIARGLRGRRAG